MMLTISVTLTVTLAAIALQCFNVCASAVPGRSYKRQDNTTNSPDIVYVPPLPNVTIYDFGLGIWPENLNVRSNGQILVTLINRPYVWQINPFLQQDGVLVHEFEGKGSCLGIVETFPDIFHLLVGNFSTTPIFNGVTGSYGVWELDFTAGNVAAGELARVSHIVEIPEAEILDGMEVLNHEAGLVLVADSKAGVLYTVDVINKNFTATISNALFNSTPELFIGIDGIKLRTNATHSYLYFTNAIKSIFGRVRINRLNGSAEGPVEALPIQFPLASGAEIVMDDFIFDDDGNAYITNAGTQQGMYLFPAPAYSAQTGQFLSSVTGPSACRFGKTDADRKSLYVTSTGGDFNYPPQNFTIAGKLSRIDIDAQRNLA